MNEHIFILPFRDENGCQCWDVRPHDYVDHTQDGWRCWADYPGALYPTEPGVYYLWRGRYTKKEQGPAIVTVTTKKILPYRGPFKATSASGTGYVTNINDENTYKKDGEVFNKTHPIIFSDVCFGAFHSYGRPYSNRDWLAALRLVSKYNRQAVNGRTNFTGDQQVKIDFRNSLSGIFRELEEIELYKKLKVFAKRRSNERCKVQQIWGIKHPNGVEWICADEDANLQAYYNKELEMTIGPKYIVSTKDLDDLPQTI